MAFKDYVNSLPNLREEKIKEIAEATCSHVNTVYRWMNGSITPPPLKREVISLVTGVSIDELFPNNKKEIEQGVKIFKEIMKLAYEKHPLLRPAFDKKATDKIIVRNLSGEQEEIVFNSTATVLYFCLGVIYPEFRSTKANGISRKEMEKCLSKMPAFIGFVKAHRFENAISSCMAFNYDVLLQDCNLDLTCRFEDLKSITYNSESK